MKECCSRKVLQCGGDTRVSVCWLQERVTESERQRRERDWSNKPTTGEPAAENLTSSASQLSLIVSKSRSDINQQCVPNTSITLSLLSLTPSTSCAIPFHLSCAADHSFLLLHSLSPLLSLTQYSVRSPSSPSLTIMAKDLLDEIAYYINPTTPPFLATTATIILCPLIWNLLARYLHYVTSTLVPSTPRIARYLLCAGMTVWIFLFSSLRDYLFHHTLQTQHAYPLLESLSTITHPLAYVLYALGSTLVLSSFYRLGLTGTFLGDYVGILMDAPVTGFPFNVVADPMYVGATMNFLASALLYDSLAGVFLTVLVGVVYAIAVQFEGPYTSGIYQQREQARQVKGKKAQ